MISVRLWSFKDGGSIKVRFLPKNQHDPKEKKPTKNVSPSKIRHNFGKYSGSKIESRKKCFWQEKGLLNWYSWMKFVLKKMGWFFISKILLRKYDFGTFWQTVIYLQIWKKSFECVDSWPIILLFRTYHLWNSTTELILV